MQRLDAGGTEDVDSFEGQAQECVFGLPLTRAHLVRPCSVLSVPAPETKMKVM